MGQAISYCSNCSKQLREVQFEQGKAFRAGERVYCEGCAPAEVRAPSTPRRRPSSPAIPTPRPMRPPPAARPAGRLPLVGAAIGGLGVTLVIIILLLSGKPAPTPPEPPKPPPPKAATAPPKSEPSPLDDARRYAREHPDDLEGQIKRFADLAFAHDGKPAGAAARKEVEALRAREQEAIRQDMLTLEREISGLIAAEAFGEIWPVLATARHRQRGSQWKLAVEKRARELEDRARILFGALKTKAAEARAKGRPGDVQALVRKVAAWDLPYLSRELADALEGIEAPPPPASAEAKLYHAAWIQATSGRDFAAAAADLEKLRLTEAAVVEERARDVRELRELAKAYPELIAAIVGPAPRFLTLGGRAGRVLSIDAERVELSFDPAKPTEFVEWNELPLHTLLSLAKRSGVPAELVARLDERVPQPSAEELRHREAFYQAERDWRDMAARGKAIEAYARLLNSPYAKRARERAQGGRDYVLSDLAFGGTFAPGPDGTLVTTSDGDGWAEAEYYALPSTSYRAWVRLGACCAEALRPLKASISGLPAAHPTRSPHLPARWDWAEWPLPKGSGLQKLRVSAAKAGLGVGLVVVSATRTRAPGEEELEELAKRAEGRSTSSPVVTLDDFERDPLSWGFVGGQEFPGAKGGLRSDDGAGRGGGRSIRLDGDFSGGGAYVGGWRVWSPPAGWDVAELRIWIKAENVVGLGVRIVDGTDQCHQKHGGVALKPTSEWQELVLKIPELVNAEHWGGANDGKWHPSFRGFGLNVSRKVFAGEGTQGTIWIDDVRAVLAPAR